MANKRRYKQEEILEAIKKSGGFLTKAAEQLGCTYHTVWNYLKKYKSLQKALEEIKEKQLDFAESKLIGEINASNLTAIIFYLKCKGKDRGYIERHEITGKDGGPITQKQVPVLDLSSLSDDELALAEKLGLKAGGNGTGSNTG